MKILLVSQYFWPENFRVNELVRDLVDRGHDVSVLTGVPNYPSGKIDPDFKSNPFAYCEYYGARIYRCWNIPRGNSSIQLIFNYFTFALMASLYGFFRFFSVPFDVVFVYQLSPITLALPAILLSRLKRAPLVFWVQDLWPDTLFSLDIIQNHYLASLASVLSSSIYNQSDLLISQSRSFVSQLSKYTKNNQSILYIPNWSEPFPKLSSISYAPQLPPDQSSFTILFTGNIGEAQDFPSLLDAAQLLHHNFNIRWVIVGSGSLSEWLSSEIKLRGLSSCFHLLGRFPYESMPSFFKSADALILSLCRKPVFSLTIPSKLQVYLQSGLPILGMIDGEASQVIKSSEAGLVCGAGDSSALALNIISLINMTSEARRSMGARGPIYANREFSKSKLLDKLESSLYDILLE